MKSYLIGAIVVILALGGAYYLGRQSGIEDTNREVAMERQAWENRVEALQKTHDEAVVQIRESLSAENARLQAQLDAIEDSSILDAYVTVEENSRLPVGFVEYHDRLVLNVPVNTIRTNNTPTKLTLRDLMTVLAKNYTMCHRDQTKLANLQAIVADFVAKQQGAIK